MGHICSDLGSIFVCEIGRRAMVPQQVPCAAQSMDRLVSIVLDYYHVYGSGTRESRTITAEMDTIVLSLSKNELTIAFRLGPAYE